MGYEYDIKCPGCQHNFRTSKLKNIQCFSCKKKFDLPAEFCDCCTYSLTKIHCYSCHKKSGKPVP